MSRFDSHISICVLRIATCILALTGNSLLLFVIFRNRRLRTNSSNLLLAQLAFAGIILGIAAGTRGVSILLFKRFEMTSYPSGLCLLLGTPTVFGMYMSQSTILAIAIDRFLCIQYPVFYRKSDNFKFALIRFLACLGFVVASCGGNFIGISFEKRVTVCSTGTTVLREYKYYTTFLTCFFTISISGFYALVFWLFRRRGNALFSNSAAQRKLFVTMTSVLASFFLLSCLPNAFLTVCMFAGFSTLQGYISVLVSVCITLTAVTNVFIYGWKHPDLRTSLKSMVAGKAVTVVEQVNSSHWRTQSHQNDQNLF